MATPGQAATNYNVLQLDGTTETVGGVSIITMRRDTDGSVIECKGATLPSSGASGYARGCEFYKTNESAGNCNVYVNSGTSTSSFFNNEANGNVVVLTLTSPDIIALSVTPCPLIAAQGAGTLILIDKVIFKGITSKVLYTAGSPVALKYGTQSGAPGGGLTVAACNTVASAYLRFPGAVPAVAIRQGTDVTGSVITSGSPGAYLTNCPISVFSSDMAYATGDGTLTITAIYEVITP